VEKARTCSESFFTSEIYVDSRSACEKLARPKETLTLSAGANVERCRWDFFNACLPYGLIGAEGFLEKNLLRFVVAHRVIGVPPTSEDPATFLQLVYLSLVLGCVTSYFGVTTVRLTLTSVGALALVIIPTSLVLSNKLSVRAIDTWIGYPEMLGGILYICLLLFLAIAMSRRRSRSASSDIAVVLLQLWPLSVLIFRLRLLFLSGRIFPYLGMTVYFDYLPEPPLFPYVAGGWIVLIGFFISRYRLLPQAT
jgi:hypothetical protein